MKKKYGFPLLCLLLIISGCATWTVVKETKTAKVKDFEVTLPGGWVKRAGSSYYLTKDGVLLQHISLRGLALNKELPGTKKQFTEEMLIQEMAELVVDEISSDKSVLGFNLIENVPAVIDTEDGFRLVYTYHNADGLTYKVIKYGFLKNERLWLITYDAAEQYYFEKDVGTYEKIVSEFKIL